MSTQVNRLRRIEIDNYGATVVLKLNLIEHKDRSSGGNYSWYMQLAHLPCSGVS